MGNSAQPSASDASVGDFIAVLDQSLGEAKSEVSTLFLEGQSETEILKTALRTALSEMIKEA